MGRVFLKKILAINIMVRYDKKNRFWEIWSVLGDNFPQNGVLGGQIVFFHFIKKGLAVDLQRLCGL